MLNKLMKEFVDLLYGTARIRRNYEESNPDEKVLAADASKGIVTIGKTDVVRGATWVTSQRSVLMLTNSKIICGKWTIPIDEIQSTQLLEVTSIFGDGAVLKVQTKHGKNYQFGMQVNPEWTQQQVVPLRPEKAKVKNSVFSIVVRVAAIGYILYWLYGKFVAN
jgi:hypothetical protein